ncbi:unnamed protein product [Cyprideis torosa]|uniref:Uncharacterized protein n=1 Tax=Cyprideis torosa TaxID=163714 RepID=A0A7R8ZTR4_9CRUS|nr:unnamed protein product [Cyprideis torosa]CAG0898619.1 unnamed protein product [Cyprideis torosa]
MRKVMKKAIQYGVAFEYNEGLVSAIMWPASALTIASVIDNPWGVCCRRSAEVGKQLAQVLLSREHGHRPVTLIGFSLGARVIHFCLVEMAKAKNCQGIIQDVVLLGAPVSGSHKLWEPLGKVVSGRIINGYSRGDWLLKLLYRTSSMNIHIAGLGPLSWKNQRVFNFDLTDIVDGLLKCLFPPPSMVAIHGLSEGASVLLFHGRGAPAPSVSYSRFPSSDPLVFPGRASESDDEVRRSSVLPVRNQPPS